MNIRVNSAYDLYVLQTIRNNYTHLVTDSFTYVESDVKKIWGPGRKTLWTSHRYFRYNRQTKWKIPIINRKFIIKDLNPNFETADIYSFLNKLLTGCFVWDNLYIVYQSNSHYWGGEIGEYLNMSRADDAERLSSSWLGRRLYDRNR